MIIVTQISISNLSTIILTVLSKSGGLNRGIGFPLLTLGTAYRVLHACFLLKRIIEEHALFYFTILTVVRASASTMLKKCYFNAFTLSILIHQFSNKIIEYYTQL